MVIINLPRYALLTLGFVFTFAYCWTFDKGFRLLFAPLMLRVAGIGIGGTRITPGVKPFTFLKDIVENVERWAANGMQASERGITYSINQLIDTVGLFFGIPLAIALVLYELAQYAVHSLGRAVTRVEHTTVIKKVTTITKAAASVTTTQVARLTARVKAIEHRAVHVTKAVAGTIANPFPRIKRAEHDLTKLGKRVKSLEKVLAGGLGVAVVVRALSKLKLGWLRCNNVGKAGRAVCGFDTDFLNALLTGALLIVGTISLVEFAEEVGAVTEEASGLIHGFLRDA